MTDAGKTASRSASRRSSSVEQLPAPVDHRPQRPVPGQRGAAAAGQQPEPVVQTGRDLPRRQRAQPGRGEFDGQRQAVQPPADLHHGRHVLAGHREPGPHCGGPVAQQLHRRVRERVVRRRRPPVAGAAAARVQRLADDAQRLPAGGQHAQPRAAAEQFLGEPGGGLDDVFAVVQHDQRLVGGDRLHQAAERVAGRLAYRFQRPVPPAERVEHGPRHVRRVGDRRQLDQPRPAGYAVGEPARRHARQPRLARAARPEQGDQPVAGEQPGEPAQVLVAPDEAGERGPQVARGVAAVGCRGAASPRSSSRCAARNCGDGSTPSSSASRCRIRSYAASASAGRPAAASVRRCSSASRSRSGCAAVSSSSSATSSSRPPGAQLRLDPVLLRGEPQLRQPRHRCRRVRRVGDLGQRRPAPQRERVAQRRPRRRRVPVTQRRPPLPGQPLEPPGVHVVRVEVEPVTAPGCCVPPSAGHRPAQPGHERLHRVRGVGRRLVAPERLGQRGHAHRPARVQGEADQQRPQPRPGDVDRPIAVADLKRPEDPHPHHATLSSAVEPMVARSRA